MMEEVFQRTQFTFYESFYKSIEKNLKKKSDRLAAFEYLCHYALYGKKPENENISDCVEGLMMAFIPFLETARRNAKNAAYPRPGANAAKEEQENKNKNKNEYKNEYKTEPEIKRPAGEFEKFWQAYPKKVGRREAEKAFQHVLAPLETLLQAVQKQGNSQQWQKECGRYIPNPATWLREERWNDLPPEPGLYQFGELELAAIERMMSTGIS